RTRRALRLLLARPGSGPIFQRQSRLAIELVGTWHRDVVAGVSLPVGEGPAEGLERGGRGWVGGEIVELMRIGIEVGELLDGAGMYERRLLRRRELSFGAKSAHGLEGRTAHGVGRRCERLVGVEVADVLVPLRPDGAAQRPEVVPVPLGVDQVVD